MRHGMMLLILLVLSPVIAAGATPGERNWPTSSQLLGGELFTLRQSSSDKNTNEEPALLVWTDSEAEDSVIIDAAVATPVGDRPFRIGNWLGNGFFKPTVEYHRSTVTAKETNSLSIGLGYEAVVSPVHRPGGMEHHVLMSVAYKDDRILTGEGLQASVAVSPLGGGWNFGDPIRIWGVHALYWMPAAAVQYERANGVLPDQAGEVARLKSAISLAVFPFESRRVSLSAGYAGWFNATRNGTFDTYDDYQELLTGSLNWNLLFAPMRADKPVPSTVVALSLDYVRGEDPEKGRPRETYTRLALKLRL